MKRAVLIAVVAALAGASLVSATPPASPPGEQLRDLLGGVDFVPTPAHLDPWLGDAPAATLIDLATAADAMDPGVRLRAYRALEHYPAQETTAALIDAVAARRAVRDGVELMYLHAAMRSLGATGGEAAIDPIGSLLDHECKDTRATAAVALGATGSKLAKPWLYDRLEVEADAMVRMALSDAIRRIDENQQ